MLRLIAACEAVGFAVLVGIAIAMPDIRAIMLVAAGAYALAAIPVYLFYGRLLDRRVRPPTAA